MEIQNRMQLKFQNKSENEMLARAAIVSFVTSIDPTVAWVNELKTAVSEAVTNVVVHAYPEKTDYVELDAKIYHDRVSIDVIDHGCGIVDVSRAKEEGFSTKSELERSGIGFQVMEAFVDKLTVESKKNEGTKITLEKMI